MYGLGFLPRGAVPLERFGYKGHGLWPGEQVFREPQARFWFPKHFLAVCVG